jgi:hypothetical protein
MNGTVVEMPDATIELEWSDETEYDEHGSRWLSIRAHNDAGQHCLLKLRNPKLLILDNEEVEFRESASVEHISNCTNPFCRECK